jgi:hypothetical protein
VTPRAWSAGSRHPRTRFGPSFCPGCDGFAYQQREPGLWVVCVECCGSAVSDVRGDREPGHRARFTRVEEHVTAAEKSGLAVKERWAQKPPSIKGFR